MVGLGLTVLLSVFIVIFLKKFSPVGFVGLSSVMSESVLDDQRPTYDPLDMNNPINHGISPGDVGYED